MHWPWDPHSHVPIWIITPAPRNLGVTLVYRLYRWLYRTLLKALSPRKASSPWNLFCLSKTNLSFNSLLICSPSLLVFSMYSWGLGAGTKKAPSASTFNEAVKLGQKRGEGPRQPCGAWAAEPQDPGIRALGSRPLWKWALFFCALLCSQQQQVSWPMLGHWEIFIEWTMSLGFRLPWRLSW